MPRVFLAASVPRHIRQSRLSYLPLSCVIGSRVYQTDGGGVAFDVIMLPPQQFQRMQAYISLQHVIAPMPEMSGSHQPVYTLRDTKQVSVPDGEADAEGFARAYFLKEFGFSTSAPPAHSPELAASENSDCVDEAELAALEEAFHKMIRNRDKTLP